MSDRVSGRVSEEKKSFASGVIVGKFSPLHRGHQLVIETALAKCRHLTIITYSEPEFVGCELGRREKWLRASYPQALVVGATNAPPNDASEIEHRDYVARVAREIARDHGLELFDAVFTSEDYGNGFAAHLSRAFGKPVTHVSVDRDRLQVPISGTKLREDVHANRKFLSPLVYADFVETVCFLGAESSGKSTIAKACAERFGSAHVDEYGRTLSEERDQKLFLEDMITIAHRHIDDEERLRGLANRYLFVDTSPLTTKFYSGALFGEVVPELEALSSRRYDHVFLCGIDFPLVQDGTRQGEEFRRKQQDFYLRELPKLGWNYTLLEGPLEERLLTVSRVLDTRSLR
ncbi:MAG: AAA family ATPase [Bdellovibrionota bacterium]